MQLTRACADVQHIIQLLYGRQIEFVLQGHVPDLMFNSCCDGELLFVLCERQRGEETTY